MSQSFCLGGLSTVNMSLIQTIEYDWGIGIYSSRKNIPEYSPLISFLYTHEVKTQVKRAYTLNWYQGICIRLDVIMHRLRLPPVLTGLRSVGSR